MRTRTKSIAVAKVGRKVAQYGEKIILKNVVLCKAAAAAHSVLITRPDSKCW